MRERMRPYYWLAGVLFLLVLFACSRAKEAPYVLRPEQLEQLKAFGANDHFAPAAWRKRGLQPPPKPVRAQMQGVVNGAVDQLLREREQLTAARIRMIMSAQLARVGIFDLNPQEKEFLAQVLRELSRILQVDVDAVVRDDPY